MSGVSGTGKNNMRKNGRRGGTGRHGNNNATSFDPSKINSSVSIAQS